MKRFLTVLLSMALVSGLTACGAAGTAAAPSTAAPSEEATQKEDTAPSEAEKKEEAAPSEAPAEAPAEAGEDTEIQVFIAASLSTVMEEVAGKFNEQHPNVKITYNADSSGTLLTQIEEGYACDVFFSAAQKQMNTLEEDDKLVVDGTRSNVVNNQVCVITLKDSGTKVTGLKDIGNASSIALADGSVPVGKYTRQAMVNAGMLKEVEDVSKITTQEVSEQLGGVEISEQSNVSKVLAAVTEGSCEVGTTYFSDTYGFEDKVEILEKVPYDLTGNVIYPIAQIVNDEADDAEKAAALDFVNFVTSDEAKAIFEKYYFDTDVE